MCLDVVGDGFEVSAGSVELPFLVQMDVCSHHESRNQSIDHCEHGQNASSVPFMRFRKFPEKIILKSLDTYAYMLQCLEIYRRNREENYNLLHDKVPDHPEV